MKFRRIMALVVFFLGLTFIAVPAVQAKTVLGGACSGAASASSVCKDSNQTTNPITGKNGILYKVARIVAIIAAVVAVFVMMAGGAVYLTANGDSGKITTARNMIIYAAVGLVIIGLAGAIITLIFNTISKN